MYYPHDLVTSGGTMYLSVVASKGAALSDPEYWMAIARGKPGADGKNGLNAYQLAIQELGFSGTIKDWLASLKGDKGDPGQPGTVTGLINTVDYSKYADMNQLTSGPVFYLSQKIDNQPVDINNSFLVVLSNSDSSVVTQFFIDPTKNNVYMRSKNAASWSEWEWITQW